MGVRMTRTPSVQYTSSNGPEYLESRSWIRNLAAVCRSCSAKARFLPCWVTQG
jgi:hypothetical protein